LIKNINQYQPCFFLQRFAIFGWVTRKVYIYIYICAAKFLL